MCEFLVDLLKWKYNFCICNSIRVGQGPCDSNLVSRGGVLWPCACNSVPSVCDLRVFLTYPHTLYTQTCSNEYCTYAELLLQLDLRKLLYLWLPQLSITDVCSFVKNILIQTYWSLWLNNMKVRLLKTCNMFLFLFPKVRLTGPGLQLKE